MRETHHLIRPKANSNKPYENPVRSTFVVGHAVEVCSLVKNGAPDLVDHLLGGAAHLKDRHAENDYPVGRSQIETRSRIPHRVPGASRQAWLSEKLWQQPRLPRRHSPVSTGRVQGCCRM